MRLVFLFAIVGAALAGPAMAGIPSIRGSVPSCISLVGSSAGVPAAAVGEFTVVIHDLADNPVMGAPVVIDLSGELDMSLCGDQMDHDALVNCGAKTVRKFTGVDGTVRFTLLGGSNGGGNAVTLLGGGRIYAGGVLVGTPTVSAYDLDGSGGLGANDMSAWFGDFGSGQPFGRSDYDCSGSIGANDLSMWLAAFGSGTMATSCGVSCP